MVVDYDLVVLGGTVEAREAAWLAVRTGARVALVAPEADWASGLKHSLTAEVLRAAVLQSGDRRPFEAQAPVDWAALRRRLELAQTIAYPHLSDRRLAELGVDVVKAVGQFSPKPRLAVTTDDRRLTARAYLVACGGRPRLPAIPDIDQVPWLHPADLLDLDLQPRRVIVLGRGSTAIATAQLLACLGSEISLITRGERLLPGHDGEVAQLATTLLTAAGVQVRLATGISAIEHSASAVTVTTERAAIKADRLLVATSLEPNLAALNLERVMPKPDRLGLAVSPQLRTCHRQIYACGAVLGGSRDSHLARHEVQVAVYNALYLPRRSVNYRTVPECLPTTPAIARVGLSETQARQYYGSAVRVIAIPVAQSLQAHLQNEPRGFCKLIIHSSGEILGGHWVGPQAGEVIQFVALMMDQGLRCQQLNRLPALPHSLMELLHQAAQQWQQQRWQPGGWRRDWSENWFNWRRTRQ